MANLSEVLHAVAQYKRFDPVLIDEIRQKKVAERGAFKDRMILDES